jgi:hypothetical protein
MRRNKDSLKQTLKDAKSSHQSEVEGLKAKLNKTQEAIRMVLNRLDTDDERAELFDVSEIDMLKAALK